MSFLYNQWDGYVVTRILSPSVLPTTSTFSQVTEQVWRKCQGVFSQIICDVKVCKGGEGSGGCCPPLLGTVWLGVRLVCPCECHPSYYQ